MRQRPHESRLAYEHRRPAPPLRVSLALSVCVVLVLVLVSFPQLTLAFLGGTVLGCVWERR